MYARVSTSEQSTDAQVDRLTAICRARGWGEPIIFADTGVSGVRDHRPALDQLRTVLKEGGISRVVVSKVDRLGRSAAMILRLWDELEAAGVPVLVVDQSIDTSTPMGRFQRTMLAAWAEFEREVILERTAEGVARARSQGKRFGRPAKISGSTRAEILRRLSNGQSSREVSQALKIPAGTIRWIRSQSRLETPSPEPARGSPRRTRPGR